jgi:fatty acid desaturase
MNTPHEEPVATPDPAAFRRKATVVFRLFVAALVLVAAGLTTLGGWLGGWWGLAGGALVGVLLLTVGLVGGTLFWAMTQDGG